MHGAHSPWNRFSQFGHPQGNAQCQSTVQGVARGDIEALARIVEALAPLRSAGSVEEVADAALAFGPLLESAKQGRGGPLKV